MSARWSIEVERFAGCPAKFTCAHTVKGEVFEDKIARFVETYSLAGHASGALRCFAWKEDDESMRFVLDGPSIHTAEDAIRASTRAAERLRLADLLKTLTRS